MRFKRIGVAFAILLAIAGCRGGTYIATTRYTVDPVIDATPAEQTDRALGIRPLEAAEPYGLKVCFRDQGHVLGQYTHTEWAEYPRDTFTRALIDAVAATQRFKDVGDALYLARPDLMLTGELRKFDEVRTTNPWTALCEVRLELREALGSEALWAATLSASEPLERNDVSALAEAMSKAVARIVSQAAEEIAQR